MKILTVLLGLACALSLGACAGTSGGASSCCGTPGAKTCPANAPHCKVPKAT